MQPLILSLGYILTTGDKMKKLFISILILLIFPVMAFGTIGTVTQTPKIINSHTRTLTFVCIGGTAGQTGEIDNTDTNTANTAFIYGWKLTEVQAFRTASGTQPDAASVLVYDESGMDLLGSIDGVTAYQGLNLIHESLKKSCTPDQYLTRAGAHRLYYPIITGIITLDVDDQITASADWTIVMIFER